MGSGSRPALLVVLVVLVGGGSQSSPASAVPHSSLNVLHDALTLQPEPAAEGGLHIHVPVATSHCSSARFEASHSPGSSAQKNSALHAAASGQPSDVPFWHQALHSADPTTVGTGPMLFTPPALAQSDLHSDEVSTHA